MNQFRGVVAVILLTGSLWAGPAQGQVTQGATGGQRSAFLLPHRRCLDGSRSVQKHRRAVQLRTFKESPKTLPNEASAPPTPTRKADGGQIEEVVYTILLLLGFPVKAVPLPLLLR